MLLVQLKKNQLLGGTAYAVEMAKQVHKRIFVFDQIVNQWFTYVWTKDYSYASKMYKLNTYKPEDFSGYFSPCDIPVLTYQFAGIGTRNLTASGKQAIKNVYTKTFFIIDRINSVINDVCNINIDICNIKNSYMTSKPILVLKKFYNVSGFIKSLIPRYVEPLFHSLFTKEEQKTYSLSAQDLISFLYVFDVADLANNSQQVKTSYGIGLSTKDIIQHASLLQNNQLVNK